jgi:hypothetical protein
MPPLIKKVESIIKDNNFYITENNLDKQVAFGTVSGVMLRITIFYRLKQIVFTHVSSNQRVVKQA